ncbi:hypothetical protein B0H16DRAFT_134224 [Mycena metata]|uniref:Uncharacterized protein n=1 Tax=Mycena metata TaxID=1033252 RepID=A0AAD7I512_9AGAR|nr:hypothetical protein B0H16DRAFT_134224 [Mycena metata]
MSSPHPLSPGGRATRTPGFGASCPACTFRWVRLAPLPPWVHNGAHWEGHVYARGACGHPPPCCVRVVGGQRAKDAQGSVAESCALRTLRSRSPGDSFFLVVYAVTHYVLALLRTRSRRAACKACARNSARFVRWGRAPLATVLPCCVRRRPPLLTASEIWSTQYPKRRTTHTAPTACDRS